MKDTHFTEQGDRNFDDLAEKFEKQIYGGFKGRNRQHILRRDLAPVLQTRERPLKILDAGAGSARFTQELVDAGHSVTICDVSRNMLAIAEGRLAQPITAGQVHLIHSSLQDLPNLLAERFDLILFHAVLEWMEQPQDGLAIVDQLLQPGGAVSVLFYNRPGLVFYHLLHGNFVTACGNRVRGKKKSLTPVNPIEPALVTDWFDTRGYKLVSNSGLRVFSDYIQRADRARLNEDEQLAAELKFSRQEPYRSMARYLHFLYSHPDGGN